ncbi:hypothetical protein JHL17_34045 [Azospirillum sp. YIM B02556]|uniref:Uncharacterized protein n=1 Tax=Azospirillum endophyticum TaxID=2800326 RepID=A0ABS1FGC1_9PROT|nr:hypothetical protein [Azospirillum endophyticum]MBK1842429.1 hypothetical protein [Azospirillum endophyticum]
MSGGSCRLRWQTFGDIKRQFVSSNPALREKFQSILIQRSEAYNDKMNAAVGNAPDHIIRVFEERLNNYDYAIERNGLKLVEQIIDMLISGRYLAFADVTLLLTRRIIPSEFWRFASIVDDGKIVRFASLGFSGEVNNVRFLLRSEIPDQYRISFDQWESEDRELFYKIAYGVKSKNTETGDAVIYNIHPNGGHAEKKQNSNRGRRKGRGGYQAADAPLVAEGIKGIMMGRWASALQAAQYFADQAQGAGTRESRVDRLQRRISAELNQLDNLPA